MHKDQVYEVQQNDDSLPARMPTSLLQVGQDESSKVLDMCVFPRKAIRVLDKQHDRELGQFSQGVQKTIQWLQ